MRRQILAAMPEFDLIQDVPLREKALQVWLGALQRGGWAVEDLGRIPCTLGGEQPGQSLLEHVRNVAGLCLAIAGVLAGDRPGRPPLDRDTLIAGALLHDVGKLLEYREDNGTFTASRLGRLVRHPVTGAALCLEYGLPDEVVHLVATHRQAEEGLPRTGEAVVLFHANRLLLES